MSYFWPFAQNPLNAIPQIINYDLVIQEPYPGICFEPTAPGGIYQEIREVDGCLWIVTNALFNPNTLQWEQDSPCNPALGAYALEQCESGNLTRYVADPTYAINTEVTWIPVWVIDTNGLHFIEPRALTSQSQVPDVLDVTWNAGSGAKMISRQENITDTSSNVASAVDQIKVDNTPVWEVRKDGTLVIGHVPFSVLPNLVQNVAGLSPVLVTVANRLATVSLQHGDYVDLTNTQSISGQKTITAMAGLLVGPYGSIGSGDKVTGITFGCKVAANPFTFEATSTDAVILAISTASSSENPTGVDVYFDSGLTIGDTYIPTLIFTIDSTGTITKGTINNTVLTNALEGVDGIQVYADGGTGKTAISGAGLIATIVSSNSSILATLTPAQTYDLSVNTSSLPVGATLQNGGGGSGGSSVSGLSIVLPGSSSDTWNVMFQFSFNGSSNNNASITITPTGTVSVLGNTGDGTTSQNANYYSNAMWTGTADGGQTVSFAAAIGGGGAPFGTYAWSIIASRKS